MAKPKILFVYNADAGMINSIKDFFKKAINPEEYQCNLCGLTYGNFAMKNEWKQFVNQLPYPSEFLHRDEFLEKYAVDDPKFPCAYFKRNNELKLLIPEAEMSKVPSLEALETLVTKHIEALE